MVGRHEIVLEGALVCVDVREGIPSFAVTGRPDVAVRELRERLRAALINAGFEYPRSRITVSITPPRAPGEIELAVAASLLVASGQIAAAALEGRSLLGWLKLDGSVIALRTLAHLGELREAAGR